jgi:hypothetical protein
LSQKSSMPTVARRENFEPSKSKTKSSEVLFFFIFLDVSYLHKTMGAILFGYQLKKKP